MIELLQLQSSWNNRQKEEQQQVQEQRGTVKYPMPTLGALEKAPSMAGLVNTTVPQRLVNRPVRGHHTPTRSSLRHSRMICLSQQGKGTFIISRILKIPQESLEDPSRISLSLK